MPKEVYILWSYDADSWNAVPMFRSVHATLESAREEIPLNIQQLKREPYSVYIENYVYNLISKMEVKGI